jgi:response regulator NasT
MSLRVLVIDDAPERAARMVESLSASGYEVVGVEDTSVAVIHQVDNASPDVVLVNAESAQRDVIEQSINGLQGIPTPIVLLDKNLDADGVTRASQVGISVYAVEDLPADALDAVIQSSVAQFSVQGELRAQIGAAKARVEEECVIGRAKTMLVERGRMSEGEAHRWMRKTAMDSGRRLIDVAKLVIEKATEPPS